MDRGVVMQNRICFYRKQYKDDQHHSNLLSTMQPRINDQEPSTQQLAFIRDTNHVYNKYDAFKFSEIDRENAHLADKMVDIGIKQQNKRFVEYPEYYAHKKNNFFVQSQRSLHKCQRNREQVRIAVDNQKLLERMKRKKSAYDSSKWEKDQHLSIPTEDDDRTVAIESVMDLKPIDYQLIQKQIDDFYVNLSSTKTLEKYNLVIKEKEGLDMLKDQYDNDIEKFVEMIDFNDEMQSYVVKDTAFIFVVQTIPVPVNDEQEQSSQKMSKQQSSQQIKQNTYYSEQGKKMSSQQEISQNQQLVSEQKHTEQDMSKYKQSEQEESKYKQSEQEESKYKQSEQEESKYKQSEQEESKYKQSEQEESKYKQSEQEESKYKQSEQEESKYKQSEQGSKYKQSQSNNDEQQSTFKKSESKNKSSQQINVDQKIETEQEIEDKIQNESSLQQKNKSEISQSIRQETFNSQNK